MSISREEQPRQRVVVVPRPLAGFFYERLCRHYAARADVRVVLDRRQHERRTVSNGVPGTERRMGERRSCEVRWSLAEMPLRTPAG